MNAPAARKSKMDIFSIKVMAKVTKSSTLVFLKGFHWLSIHAICEFSFSFVAKLMAIVKMFISTD